ncbi:hypothetical protein Fot_54719 [Forsythia ovata]|uniref:ATP-dependent DNA helicase n=1 Tax=Forsythia ovata TaxID=205694 RepID=A0ABD1P6H0_9LAMI
MQTEDGTCGDMNRELNYVQDEGNIGDAIADGNFVDWDGLNIIPNSPRRENLHEKSPMTVAHCPREGVIYNNIENLTYKNITADMPLWVHYNARLAVIFLNNELLA